MALLIDIGESVLPDLIERAPSLNARGQLGAIDVFVELNATSAGPALIAMLDHEDERVRGWAAGALGDLAIKEAVPHLQELLLRSKAAETPPSWSEPTNARGSLTRLGARTPVIPDVLQPLLVTIDFGGLAVPCEHLDLAFDALRDADQVTAYFQRWQPWSDTWSRVDGAGWELDWTAPWHELVTQSHEEARSAPLTPVPDAVATIEWLDQSDWVAI